MSEQTVVILGNTEKVIIGSAMMLMLFAGIYTGMTVQKLHDVDAIYGLFNQSKPIVVKDKVFVVKELNESSTYMYINQTVYSNISNLPYSYK